MISKFEGNSEQGYVRFAVFNIIVMQIKCKNNFVHEAFVFSMLPIDKNGQYAGVVSMYVSYSDPIFRRKSGSSKNLTAIMI